jgi:hypothetical protein
MCILVTYQVPSLLWLLTSDTSTSAPHTFHTYSFRTVDVHAEALAHERSPLSQKCTTLTKPVPSKTKSSSSAKRPSSLQAPLSPPPAQASIDLDHPEPPKRHLRHVTPGAGTPDLLLFGCDNLPHDLANRLLQPERWVAFVIWAVPSAVIVLSNLQLLTKWTLSAAFWFCTFL